MKLIPVAFLISSCLVVQDACHASKHDALMVASLAPQSYFHGLPNKLAASLDDIFLPPGSCLEKAEKIFRRNPPRVREILDRLRTHGASRLHVPQVEIDTLAQNLAPLEHGGSPSGDILEALTGMKNPNLVLLALDHALEPVPYHTVCSRSWFLTQQDR